jgi:hypothetical protein
MMSLSVYGNVVVVTRANVFVIPKHGGGFYKKCGFVGKD